MSSISSKHPKKKRRIDDIQEPLPGSSSAVVPLIVKKSSKNASRGMHSIAKGKSKPHSHASFPQFVKASELYKRLPQNVEETKSKPVDSASDNLNSDETLQEQVSPDTNKPSNSKIDSDSISSRQQIINCVTKGKRRANFPARKPYIKITRLYEGLDPAKNRIVESVPKTKSSVKEKKVIQPAADNEQDFKNFREYYELIENSIIQETGEDYFMYLPTHVIETILCQIPMLDLTNCRLVCHRWREIIDNEKFMEWKKCYYEYKSECSTPNLNHWQNKLKKLVVSLDHKAVEDCIATLIKYMGKEFNRRPSADMYNLLIQNPQGDLADQLMSERFPEWNGKESRVWCQFALAILISETVWEILEVYKSLFTSKSGCPRTDVINAMYCVAAFLLYYRSTDNINCGLHYRVYYALYMIENHIPDSQRDKLKRVRCMPGQQSIYKYCNNPAKHLTYEQIRILNHRFDMNQKIRIVALAGTGKTTTLVYLSQLYPQFKFLNLVFNKSVNEEAKKIFPSNVTCRTAHSLAYAAVGKFLQHKLTTTLRPYDLIGHLKHNDEHIQIYAYANLVLTTINNFTLSKSTLLDLEHVPTLDFNRKILSLDNRKRIHLDAFAIWEMMTEESDSFKITHDVYLKLYHLKKPKLNKYQCIMVDEAQDCNPVILDIALSQDMPVIFVGDSHQQIYGFRGAQNALQHIKATHTYYLTKSFRFGPEISYIASCVLEILLNARSNTIVGSTDNSFINGNVLGKFAVISRTNIMLFNEALRMIVFKRLKPHEPSFIRATFAGGFNSYGFDQISDIYKLKNVPKAERQLSDKFICRFKTYNDLVNYARYSDDADLLSKIEIVNQHGHDISKFITLLKAKCSHPMKEANVIFSTAHKAKGLEFDTVSLTDDYPISTVPGFLECESSRDEANILYVAITRAKSCLMLPEKISKVLHLAHEKFEYPVSSELVLRDNAELKCLLCERIFIPHTVLFVMRRKTVMSSGREIAEGPLCVKCSSDPYMRPDVHMNGLIMYLDPTKDNCHCFISRIVGPLPDDPPIVHDRFSEFENADRVFVINLNIH